MSLTEVERRRSHKKVGSSIRPWWISIAISLAFLTLRLGALDQPPVWDGAMGMTPAAITLESTDFDIGGLLEMPDYRAGGPNVHSLSLATWFVAISIRLFGSYQAALPALHLVSFVLLGLLGAGVFRAVGKATGSLPLGLAAAFATVVFPPLVVQASDVYLDLPLAVALTWSFVYLYESRLQPSVLLLAVAAAIKPSALIAVPPAAYFVWKTEDGNRKRALLLLLIPVAVAMIEWVTNASLRAGSDPTIVNAFWTFYATVIFLRRMPVLIVFILVLAALPAIVRYRRASYDRGWATLISSLLFPVSFIYFFLMNPLVTKGWTALPRYTTMFLPVAVIGFCVGIAMIARKRVALLSCLAVGCVFALNLHGALEPRSSNAFWIAERSLEYEKQLAVQKEAFDEFAQRASTMPALYDHYAHYRIEYPEMGWTDHKIPSGLNLNIETNITGEDLPTLPDEFVMLIEGNWLGGIQLREIHDAALASPEHSVEVDEIAKGGFSSQVVVVRRTP